MVFNIISRNLDICLVLWSQAELGSCLVFDQHQCSALTVILNRTGYYEAVDDLRTCVKFPLEVWWVHGWDVMGGS